MQQIYTESIKWARLEFTMKVFISG